MSFPPRRADGQDRSGDRPVASRARPSAGGPTVVAADGFASYEGKSGFLRWWPKILLAAALWVLSEGGMSAIQWATFFALAAWIGGHRRLGYLLHDGVLYVPDQQSRPRLALNDFGYRVVLTTRFSRRPLSPIAEGLTGGPSQPRVETPTTR
jgi:hypothetical protein